MFGKGGSFLRGLRQAAHRWQHATQERHRPGHPHHARAAAPWGRGVAAAAGASAGALTSMLAKGGSAFRLMGGGALVGGGAVVAWNGREQGEAAMHPELSELAWVQELAAQRGLREVSFPGRMLRNHPVGALVTEDDHLFENMLGSQQIRDFRCFFHPEERKFYSVVLLGKNVAGYPATVHGGLTAAIVDETLGGLYTSLLAGGKLGVTLPGLTARLEVDYKRPVPAGGVLLVTTQVDSIDGRKVWMSASVTDGTSASPYAQGRALFVAPTIGRKLQRLMGGGGGAGKAAPTVGVAAAP